MFNKSDWTLPNIISLVLLVVIAFSMLLLVTTPAPQPVTKNVTPASGGAFEAKNVTACYFENGGAAIDCDSGGTIKVNSGAGLVISGSATVVSIGGTPVVPFSTPVPTATPECFSRGNVTVLGSATLVAGAFPTPVSYASGTLNSALTTDNGGGMSVVTTTNSVTVNVYQRFLSGTVTPQAATTPVTVSYCTR